VTVGTRIRSESRQSCPDSSDKTGAANSSSQLSSPKIIITSSCFVCVLVRPWFVCCSTDTMNPPLSLKMKRQQKNEKKEKVVFLVKWLVIMFSVADILLHIVFLFLGNAAVDSYSIHFDVRYYYWYLALALLSLVTLIYGALREDYLWLWSAGTMIFIVLFLGVTGEASMLLLGTFTVIMIMAFVYGKMVRYRPRSLDSTAVNDV
jgi:hypothetical protein